MSDSHNTLQALHDAIQDCQKCVLATSRTLVVFGHGNSEADIMFVGETPGYRENCQNLRYFLDQDLPPAVSQEQRQFLSGDVDAVSRAPSLAQQGRKLLQGEHGRVRWYPWLIQPVMREHLPGRAGQLLVEK